mmetsp:Transcript_10804/g.27265  ORF Transcript_10804/g.27265 Transcript_10804/m.27265 type:complete len:141 (+) Transcript_10804:1-423(+)
MCTTKENFEKEKEQESAANALRVLLERKKCQYRSPSCVCFCSGSIMGLSSKRKHWLAAPASEHPIRAFANSGTEQGHHLLEVGVRSCTLILVEVECLLAIETHHAALLKCLGRPLRWHRYLPPWKDVLQVFCTVLQSTGP